jgi:hypothetical protein
VDPSHLQLFFTGTPLEVLRAARDASRLAAGKVESFELWERHRLHPERKGPLGEPIFGPIFPYECACRTTMGREHDGERCPRCSVVCGPTSLRDTTWGWVESGISLLHPRLVGTIAEILAWSEDDVRAVAYARAYVGSDGKARHEIAEHFDTVDSDHVVETRAPALRDVLAKASGPVVDALGAEGFAPTDLILRHVPMPPPGTRPSEPGLGGRPVPSLKDVLWSRFLKASSMAARLFELEAPPIVIMSHVVLCQRAFDTVVRATSGEALDLWQEGRGPIEVTIPEPGSVDDAMPDGPKPTELIGVRFCGDELFLRFPTIAARVDVEGRVKKLLHARGQSVWASAQHLVSLSSGGGWAPSTLHVLDLKTGKWQTELPEGFSGVVADEVVEQAQVVEVRTGRVAELREIADYPCFMVSSPDGKWIWAEDKEGNGGIYEAATGRRHVLADGASFENERVFILGTKLRPAAESPVALHVAGRYIRTLSGGVVRIQDRVALVVEGEVRAAAFSDDGRQLALATKKRLELVWVDDPESSSGFDLAPIVEKVRAALAKRRRR